MTLNSLLDFLDFEFLLKASWGHLQKITPFNNCFICKDDKFDKISDKYWKIKLTIKQMWINYP